MCIHPPGRRWLSSNVPIGTVAAACKHGRCQQFHTHAAGTPLLALTLRRLTRAGAVLCCTASYSSCAAMLLLGTPPCTRCGIKPGRHSIMCHIINIIFEEHRSRISVLQPSRGPSAAAKALLLDLCTSTRVSQMIIRSGPKIMLECVRQKRMRLQPALSR